MTKRVTNIFVGVDVSKDHLDVYLLPSKKHMRIKNNSDGLNYLLRRLKKLHVSRIVCEASGGYESLLVSTMSQAEHAIWRIDPKRIKAFIASEGVKAKTDSIDAAMIALFAQQKQLAEYARIKSQKIDAEKLKAIVKRKETLTRIAAQEKTRLKHPQQSFCRQEIKDHITFIAQQIKILEQEIGKKITNNENWQQKSKIITSIPGIGETTTASLIAHIPELGTIGNKQVAALAGLVPYTCQSGNQTKQSRIREGRSAPRKALYMAALSAIQYNHDMKIFYNRLVKLGKKKKVALVAVMRKLIILVNVLICENRVWKELNV